MKAILVVDIPDGYGDIDDNKAVVTLRNGKLGTSLRICNVPLKPMPQKKQHTEDDYEDAYDYWGIEGFNSCLEEIEK